MHILSSKKSNRKVVNYRISDLIKYNFGIEQIFICGRLSNSNIFFGQKMEAPKNILNEKFISYKILDPNKLYNFGITVYRLDII